ncbi:protein-tyrosine phosphatase family protein [Granulicoccus sp. GXG6511]|uniref:protein-tyrosine phosphatase family protein n=1 Tax=Granulicoccus sp. GXG6511 TaxID=3381351 RepID=UPI003D7E15CE
MTWRQTEARVVLLPTGRLIRGRPFRNSPGEAADWTLLLSGVPSRRAPYPSRWVCWPDFWVPIPRVAAASAFREAYERSVVEKVDVTCRGGVGRTGTALAAIAMLDGLSAMEAMRLVRSTYHPRAVETPWQRRWLEKFEDRF